MISNYLKIVWRNLINTRSFSRIYFLGLSPALATSMLIILWTVNASSIDKFHYAESRLFFMHAHQDHHGVVDGGFYTPNSLTREMRTVLPDFQYSTSMAWSDEATFERNGKILKRGDFADEDFFRMFNYRLLEGTVADALKEAVNIAISRKMVDDYLDHYPNRSGDLSQS